MEDRLSSIFQFSAVTWYLGYHYPSALHWKYLDLVSSLRINLMPLVSKIEELQVLLSHLIKIFTLVGLDCKLELFVNDLLYKLSERLLPIVY